MLKSCSINPHGFQAKVGDFGLSRESDAPARIAGNLYGTITHMAPEVMMEAQIGPVSTHLLTACMQLVNVLIVSSSQSLVNAFSVKLSHTESGTV